MSNQRRAITKRLEHSANYGDYAAPTKRLSVARQEIAQWKNFDYLLVSTSINEDLRRMLSIIEAEKMRPARVQPPDFQ